MKLCKENREGRIAKKFILILLASIFLITLAMYPISIVAANREEVEEKADPFCFEQDASDGIDYVIHFPEGKEITILQIADTQAVSYHGIRTTFTDSDGNEYQSLDRFYQIYAGLFTNGITDTHIRTWQYVEEGVEKTKPDLIVLTGDNVYGETDDSGALWLEMIDVLDSFEIPWLCIFGNHDNESQMGVNWQIEAVRNSKYGYIKDGDLQNGNSNYTVGLKQGAELKYVLYMLDTNGCTLRPDNLGESMLPSNPDLSEIQQSPGIYSDQIEWIRERDERISGAYGCEIPSMMFLHIPPIEVREAVLQAYDGTYDDNMLFFANKENDMGFSLESISGFDTDGEFFEAAREANCVGMFMGHNHKTAISIFYEGIRLTYGLKTGVEAYHDRDLIGTTKITIAEEDDSFRVDYISSEIEYPFD